MIFIGYIEIGLICRLRIRYPQPWSISPRATKKHQNHLRVVFCLDWRMRFRHLGLLALVAYSNIDMYNVHMTLLRFEWEPRKATANFKKHGISFEEAKSVFYDERAKVISDPDHSEDEDRFILLGVSHSLRVILVCHCYRSEGNIVRIISARKATPKESSAYKR